MKTRIITIGAVSACLFLSLGSMSADDKQAADKQQAKTAAKKSTPAPSATGLPAGAVLTAPGTYSYTDPQGKKWTYRQTPFGVARIEEGGTPAVAAEIEKKQAEQTRAFEDGDSIRFERPGPFGVYRWKQKKTALNSLEQTVWDRDRARQSAAREKE
jgi:hypothetical protein